MKQLWMKSIKVSRNPVSGLLDWSDQKANRLFLLLFEEKTVRTRHTGYFPPNAEIKDYNIMIDNRTFFGHLVKNYIRAYDNIERPPQAKEVIIELGACYITDASKKTTSWFQ